jgi:Effector protein
MPPPGRKPSPLGVNPTSSARPPGPLGTGGPITLAPTRPVLFMDSSFTATEQSQILAALQGMTDDKLTQNGTSIFADGLGKATTNHKTGQTLIRGLQHPTRKVILVPQTSSFVPDTKQSGNDILVELAFASGNLATFHFFVITGTNASGPGGNAIEKSPGYIALAHEMVHAFRMLRNGVVSGSKDNDFSDPSGNKFTEKVRLEELRVVGIDGAEPISENRIRAEQGLGSRIAYASPTLGLDKQGVKPVSAQPSWWPDCPTP